MPWASHTERTSQDLHETCGILLYPDENEQNVLQSLIGKVEFEIS